MVMGDQATVSALALKVGPRFYCGFDKNGRLRTAWSLAGAYLFLPDTAIGPNEHRMAVCRRLERLKKSYEIIRVGITAEDADHG
jgi:hypothetical protein